MTDTLTAHQMGRKQSHKNNKRTTSVASRKSKLSSSSIENVRKFQPHVDGFNALLLSCTKLSKFGNEFTWHDIRKNYHKETSRNLTVEELNAIFSVKNMTKRELFELPNMKRFLEPLDGTMLCRFRLIQSGLEGVPWKLPEHSVTPQISTSYTPSEAPSSPVESEENDKKPIEISTDLVEVKNGGPTSDLSDEAVTQNGPFSQQLSHQSSLTDDEGWVSGRETRSDNSSPNFEKREEDEGTTETDGKRMAAGSDECDGVVLAEVLNSEELNDSQIIEQRPSSPIVVTESLEAAFKAVVNSFENTAIVVSETRTENVSQSLIKPAPRTTKPASPKIPEPIEIPEQQYAETDCSPSPIRKLIEKFDTAVNFKEVEEKDEPATPNKTIYQQVLEEIGEENETKANVVFRTTPTHSSIISDGKVALEQFVAEQKEKKKSVQVQNTSGSDAGFAVKEQSSMSSLEREYFESRMCTSAALFEELGIDESEGFAPKKSPDSKNVLLEEIFAKNSMSNESGVTSEGLVTVIERKIEQTEESPKRREHSESDGDIPYSLCSEDEAEPITTIEKSMQPTNEHGQNKGKTVLVNVELDASKAKNDVHVDVKLKERIAALQSAAKGKQIGAPIAQLEGNHDNERVDIVHLLNRTEELETSVLEVKPSDVRTNSDGSRRAGRRQVRFIRGCCVVM